MRLGLVACSKTKADRRCPARDLYWPSPLFRGRVSWVEGSCDRWWILSARHGLVSPDEVLDPYDETLYDAPRQVRVDWALDVLTDLWRVVRPGDTVEIHAGLPYREDLVPDLEGSGVIVEVPAGSLSIGHQLALYGRGPLLP